MSIRTFASNTQNPQRGHGCLSEMNDGLRAHVLLGSLSFRMFLPICVIACMLVSLVALLRPIPAFASEPQLTEAQAACVIDANGRILWSKNPESELGLASVTKVMCAMVALDSGKDLNQTHTLIGIDTGPNSQAAGYKAGDTATLKDLLQVLLVFSANDAAEEIAHIVAGSEQAYVELMNRKAQSLGMLHTHFVNPHGLQDPDHYSSVLDMVAMGRYALANYPFIAQTVQMHSVEINAGGQRFGVDSTDELLKSGYEGILGIKTGSIESGTTFLGAAERDGLRVYTAVLGCKTSAGRFNDTAAMMDWVWDNFSKTSLSYAGSIIRWQPSWDNFQFKCPVYVETSETGWVQRDSDPLSWQRTGKQMQALVHPGDTYALTNWRQGSRQIATVRTIVGAPMTHIPAFCPTMMPLFAPVPSLVGQSTSAAAA